jgi:hypothetical protein
MADFLGLSGKMKISTLLALFEKSRWHFLGAHFSSSNNNGQI